MEYWGEARATLGISSEEFWESTPRELTAMLKVWRRNEDKRLDAGYWQAGTIAAAVYNTNPYRKDTSKVWEAPDFFTHLKQGEDAREPTDAEIKANAKHTYIALGRIGTWHEAPKPNGG